jgi:hypothetical protein
MRILNLDKSVILRYSVYKEPYYEYCLGEPLEIISTKAKHSNQLMADNLSSNKLEDRFMLKYSPTNKIYFTENFLKGKTDENFISCLVDEKTSRVIIGRPEEFPLKTGVITFSHRLSMNDKPDKEICVYANSKVANTVKQRVKILAIGVKDNITVGLIYVSNSKGLAVELLDKENIGISTQTLREKNLTGYTKYSLDNWFNQARVRRL